MTAPRSVKAMLEGLRDRFGWAPVLEGEQHHRADARTARTSGWSRAGSSNCRGAPLRTIHETCDEVNEHLREVKPVADAIGVGFIGLGAAPHWTP